MLFNGIEFKSMQSSMDALWLKQKVISDNIANYETPGYKAKSVEFSQVLEEATDPKKDKIKFKATISTQNDTSIRPDGNNVNMEKESIEMWRSYAQYSYLSDKINAQFKNMRYVINNALK